MMKDEREIRVTRYELRVAYCVVSFKFHVSCFKFHVSSYVERGAWCVTPFTYLLVYLFPCLLRRLENAVQEDVHILFGDIRRHEFADDGIGDNHACHIIGHDHANEGAHQHGGVGHAQAFA